MTIPLMNETPPESIQLLMKLWEVDERFLPDSITGWGLGEYKSPPADWRWGGGTSQSGGDVYLRHFRSWTKLDQQTLLENAVGKIFSVGSAYHKTVIQLHGTEVSVKHRDLKVIRRYKSQPTMLGNLFNALAMMVTEEWLPQHLAKDGLYYYSRVEMDDANHYYELEMMTSTREILDKHKSYTPKLSDKLLPGNDPFSGSSMDHVS